MNNHETENFENGLITILARQFSEFCDSGCQAMRELESQVAAHPDDVDALNAMGLRYLRDAKHVLANLTFERSLRLDPHNLFARLGLACSMESLGKVEAAWSQVSRCIDLNPHYQPTLAALNYLRHKLAPDRVSGRPLALSLG